ncbi:MAG: response regulator [Candidatus Moranbacteria bacterium CG_4_9_14_3_um_filter_42_9]|nr:MAG: response regulator [Candidatus Moranbacteria bacterium CG_4_9_14_3_um_filter_42_9]
MPNSKKIMIVEDDSFVLDIYQTKLSQEGYTVIEARNGVEAMKKLEKEKPDLLLLDIVMPYMDGIEVLKKIRERADLKNMPVILLTNLSQKEEINVGLGLGASDYLIKSHFTPSEVMEKIKIYLPGKKAEENKN